MILELDKNEILVFDSFSEAGLSDYAIIAEMFTLFGMEIRVVDIRPKTADVPVFEEGCDAV